ncbi:MAG: hypothetical protein WA211_15260 [Candidatus Acidiferrales bacterium]
MAEPASGIIPAASYGEREPPAPRGKAKEKARAQAAPAAPPGEAAASGESGADEIEKHELDTMA